MKKEQSLVLWKSLTENKPILPNMTPIPYKATGSRYGACGIRIDGNSAFIDSVLSHLKELLDGENHVTRLELARTKVDGSKFGKSFGNADSDAEVCYIRLHVRGHEGAIASSIFDKHLADATERYAKQCNLF